MVAKVQGHKNPFHPDLMALTMPQIDYILEMQARDDPDHYTFTRGNKAAPTNALAAWYNIFEGGALQRFLASKLNLNVIQKRRAEAKSKPVFGFRGKGVADGLAPHADGSDQGSGSPNR